MTVRQRGASVPIERVSADVLVVPTEQPESDGTIRWTRTVLVIVHVEAGGERGIGWTYAHAAAADLVVGPLARVVDGRDAMATNAAFSAMSSTVRNIGRPGLAAEAISAVDVALWDLKAKLLGVSLSGLLGAARESVAVYGSGGFTSYDDAELEAQLAGWAERGITMVKMKVGREPRRDPQRVRGARRAVGPHVELFVDANGAYARKQALAMAAAFADEGVTWFEEPVSSEDLEGLRLLRDRAPAPIEITAGEYGYVADDFRRLLDAGAVDVLMLDATRCGGVTGSLAVDGLADAHAMPLSTHCAPQIHAHVACALRRARHVEYFHDHARIERMLFDGALEPVGGRLVPDLSRPGLGVEIREREAARFAA